MEYIINGGNRLSGEIAVYGAKNCALPLLGASVLVDDEIVLHNCPYIVDVVNMISLLKAMGKTVVWNGDTVIVSGRLNTLHAPKEYAALLRGSALILGSAIARYNEIELPLPGGCAIGSRPIDIHLAGLQALGVDVRCLEDCVICRGKPQGARYHMRFASVGATENLLCASVLAQGETVLTNVATEPEVVALEQMLVDMGANIDGVGGTELTIRGTDKLHGTEFTVIPDRIVAATYLSAVVAATGSVTVTNCRPEHLRSFINKLETRFTLKEYADAVTLTVEKQPTDYGRITTAPYPFFPTDMQSLMMSLGAFADGGKTFIYENLFENRLSANAAELNKMGAEITVKDNKAVIVGRKLRGDTVFARDLRGGAGLVIAGLNAQGRTVVCGVEHINRGYYNLSESLAELGADITEST